MTTVPMRELRNHTSDVLRRVQAGEDVTVTQNGVPVASLIPIRTRPRGPINRTDLVRLLQRHQADATLSRDIERLSEDTTDDLGPIQ